MALLQAVGRPATTTGRDPYPGWLLAEPVHTVSPKTQMERFQLFSDCRPMLLEMEVVDEARAIGLTTATLRAAAESRLRAARLYTEDVGRAGFTLLYVNATVVGAAFNVRIEYNKTFADKFGEIGSASTWQMSSTGTHDRDPGYILSQLSRAMNEFLVAYLRANEPACESPPDPHS